MWAKIITIKRTKDLNYFSLCALNLFNTRVSQFELNCWNKCTFPRHSNLLRCTWRWSGQIETHLLILCLFSDYNNSRPAKYLCVSKWVLLEGSGGHKLAPFGHFMDKCQLFLTWTLYIANKSDIRRGKALSLYCDQTTFMLLHVKLNVVTKVIIKHGYLQNL